MKTALKSGSSELLKAFDVLSLPAFIIDAGGKVVICNGSAAQAFGWRQDEMIGLDAARFLSLEGTRSGPALSPAVSAPLACFR